MRRADVPVLHRHEAQHRLLLGEITAARPNPGALDAAALRRTLAQMVELVEAHVGSIDRVTAQFLRGALDPVAVSALRLPEAVDRAV